VLSATLKSLARGRVWRFFFSVVAVELGIAFLAGTLMLTDSVQRGFDDLYATLYSTTDAQVRTAEAVDIGFGVVIRSRFDESVVADVAAVDGIDAAIGAVGGTATVVAANGETLGNLSRGQPPIGLSWIEDDVLNRFQVLEGRAPTGPAEVVLDRATVLDGGFVVGDDVRILTTSGSAEYQLVGVVQLGDSAAAGPGTTALFETSVAQEVMGAVGQFDTISIRSDPLLSQAETVERVAPFLPPELEVIPGTQAVAENQDAVRSSLGFITTFLTVFAGLSMVVSAFVIANTFSILIAQRTQEIGLFRAIGASRAQVTLSVMVEAAVVGLLGSILGIVLGIGFSYLMRSLVASIGVALPDQQLLVVDRLPRTIVISIVLGVLVTLLATLLPALRAARITPIEALRQSMIEPDNLRTSRLAFGLVTEASGWVAIWWGLREPDVVTTGGGISQVFLGLFVLGPLWARPASWLLGRPVAAMGPVGNLAVVNSVRNAKRTAHTALALTLSVAVVVVVTVLASSLQASIRDTFARQFIGDVALTTGDLGLGGFSPELTARVAELPEVELAAGVRVGAIQMDGQPQLVSVADSGAVFDVLDIGLVEGFAEDFSDETIFLHVDRAADLGVAVGDQLTIGLGFLQETVTVAGVYTEQRLAGNQAITSSLYSRTGAEQLNLSTYIRLVDGVPLEQARQQIEALAVDYPNVNVEDREQFVENRAAGISQLLGLIYVLLGLAAAIAAFGIANTLQLAVVERTREIGLLRSVGMLRRQVSSMIRYEAVIIAVLGAALGVVLGVAWGYALVESLRDEGVTRLIIPLAPLLVVVGAAILVGIVFSLLPASRAARMNVLEAVSGG
jgi:putative ABC transport system permease protein